LETIGEKLRAAREAKKLTIKEVVKETNINPLYIEALEEEKFDKFPSETYLIGFLKNYAEFLRLDVDAIVKAYKGYKIGESATPLEELTRPTNSSFSMMVSSLFNRYRNLVYVAGVVIVVLLVISVFRLLCVSDVDISHQESLEDIRNKYSEKNKEIENLRNLTLTNNRGSILVYKKEAVQFMVDTKEVVFVLKEIGAGSVDLEITPGKIVERIEMDRPKTLKIAGCPRDVQFSLKGLTENRASIMVVLGEKEEVPAVAKIPEKKEEPMMKGDNTTVTATNKQSLKIVLEAEFTQKSFIELYCDGVRKLRSFMPEGTKERWEATDNIQIKIGNAGGMQARINGRDFKSFGAPGQVVNKVIRWKRDVNNPNMYHIVIQDW
jgi:transcriptional regulator with XRE-family HTH domain